MQTGLSSKVLSSLQLDAQIELWDIDMRPMGGEFLHLCNQLNEKGQNVVWRGREYQAYPFETKGFKHSSNGPSSRPTLNMANINGLATAVVANDQIIGAYATRRVTLARYLDAVNFEGEHTTADGTQELVQIFVVERVSSLNAEGVQLELALPSESDNALLPRRIVIANICQWRYRGEGCGYVGGPVADENDRPTGAAEKDKCSYSLVGCRMRFGDDPNGLPFGGFPSVDKVLRN